MDSAYRRARRLEGEQQYRAAAALYLESGAYQDAAQALMFEGALAGDLGQQVTAFREAARWLGLAIEGARPGQRAGLQEKLRGLQARLARLLVERAGSGPLVSSEVRGWLREAAERYHGIGHHREAAELCLRLGDHEGAKANHHAAGDYEALEQLLERERRQAQQDATWERRVRQLEESIEAGARREAYRELAHAAAGVSEAQQRQWSLVQQRWFARRPTAGQLTVEVGGRRHQYATQRQVVVGRSDSDWTLRDPLVSRRHMRLEVTDQGVRLTDLGSRQGLSLRGVALTTPAELACPVEVALSPATTLAVRRHGQGVHCEVATGPDQGASLQLVAAAQTPAGGEHDGVWVDLDLDADPWEGVAVGKAPRAELAFVDGWGQVRASGGRLLVNGVPCRGPVALLIGDEVAVEHERGPALRFKVVA